MITHIDTYFNPSGTVDSLSHIFDLIDIKQAQDESVITLKAGFSHVFASLKMGALPSTRRCRSALCSGPSRPPTMGSFRTSALVATHCLPRHFKRSSTNVWPTTKTHGKAPLTKLASPLTPPPPMPLAHHLATKPTLMKPWRCAHLVSMSHDGAAPAKTIATSAWSATIHHTSLPITPRIAPSSDNSGSSWSSAPQPMVATPHLVSG